MRDKAKIIWLLEVSTLCNAFHYFPFQHHSMFVGNSMGTKYFDKLPVPRTSIRQRLYHHPETFWHFLDFTGERAIVLLRGHTWDIGVFLDLT
jgi:hypothetical protein